MDVYTDLTFEAAHRLPAVPPDHRCARMHGHSYKLRIHVRGAVDPATGWVVDFAEIERVARPLIARLDHYCLNDVEGLENPTSEHIVLWLWTRLAPELPGLLRLTLDEGVGAGCSYEGPGA